MNTPDAVVLKLIRELMEIDAGVDTPHTLPSEWAYDGWVPRARGILTLDAMVYAPTPDAATERLHALIIAAARIAADTLRLAAYTDPHNPRQPIAVLDEFLSRRAAGGCAPDCTCGR